jgi:hypothetical protein
VHGVPGTEWHDKIVQYIKEKETIYAFSFADLWFIKNMVMDFGYKIPPKPSIKNIR